MKRNLTYFIALLLTSLSALATPQSSLTLNPIEPTPVLSLSDLSNASVTSEAGRTILKMHLTQEGQLKIKNFSSKHLGENLAILVDGKVLAAPAVKVPITGTSFQVDALDGSDAERLAKLINESQRQAR